MLTILMAIAFLGALGPPDSPAPASTACAKPYVDAQIIDDDAFANLMGAAQQDFSTGTASWVRFRVEVSADGKEKSLSIDSSSDGSANISSAHQTLDAARFLHFTPKFVNCNAVDGVYELRVSLK